MAFQNIWNSCLHFYVRRVHVKVWILRLSWKKWKIWQHWAGIPAATIDSGWVTDCGSSTAFISASAREPPTEDRCAHAVAPGQGWRGHWNIPSLCSPSCGPDAEPHLPEEGSLFPKWHKDASFTLDFYFLESQILKSAVLKSVILNPNIKHLADSTPWELFFYFSSKVMLGHIWIQAPHPTQQGL